MWLSFQKYTWWKLEQPFCVQVLSSEAKDREPCLPRKYKAPKSQDAERPKCGCEPKKEKEGLNALFPDLSSVSSTRKKQVGGFSTEWCKFFFNWRPRIRDCLSFFIGQQLLVKHCLSCFNLKPRNIFLTFWRNLSTRSIWLGSPDSSSKSDSLCKKMDVWKDKHTFWTLFRFFVFPPGECIVGRRWRPSWPGTHSTGGQTQSSWWSSPTTRCWQIA